MFMDTKTESWLDQLGSQVPNAYDSFVVRAPKTTLLSTKTVSANASTSTPAAQQEEISPDVFRRRVRRDLLTNDNTSRLLPLHPLPSPVTPSLPPIAEEEDAGKIPARAAIVYCDCYDCTALRRTVSCVGAVDTPQESTGLGETRDQDAVIAPTRARASCEHRSLQSSGRAAARHTSRSSGWGLVGWDKYRIAYPGVLSDATQSGATQRVVVKRRSSM
ncbi:hypothetical protein T484DRAFT_1842367 [Baffinella frigidus]|nr:hypothetical protein T484DRAFT_1842367 [Cryptophyta sp. CCMP2293]